MSEDQKPVLKGAALAKTVGAAIAAWSPPALDDVADQSLVGLSHDLCEHHVAAATCPRCIFGEAGNRVLIDYGAAQRVESFEASALAKAMPDELREQVAELVGDVYGAGYVDGVAGGRGSELAHSVMRVRDSDGPPDAADLVRVLTLMDRGQIDRRTGLGALASWIRANVDDLAREQGTTPDAVVAALFTLPAPKAIGTGDA